MDEKPISQPLSKRTFSDCYRERLLSRWRYCCDLSAPLSLACRSRLSSSDVSCGRSNAIVSLSILPVNLNGNLVVVIVHRCARVRADVERLVPREKERHRVIHLLRRNHLPIHLQCACTTAANTG